MWHLVCYHLAEVLVVLLMCFSSRNKWCQLVCLIIKYLFCLGNLQLRGRKMWRWQGGTDEILVYSLFLYLWREVLCVYVTGDMNSWINQTEESSCWFYIIKVGNSAWNAAVGWEIPLSKEWLREMLGFKAGINYFKWLLLSALVFKGFCDLVVVGP